MSSIPTAPPSGFRDFLPAVCAGRARAVETILRVYRAHGFAQIATSAVEDLAVLTGKGGGENEKLIFKILKRGDKLAAARSDGDNALADLGLRFDLTLPLARFFSKNAGVLPRPFKAFQIGPVWRAERAQKGRYREFFQCDVDIIGTESSLAEVEVLTAIRAVFSALGIEQPKTVFNDRRLLFALLEDAGITPDQHGAVCVLLDKLDKSDRASVLAEIEALVGAPAVKKLEQLTLGTTPDTDHLRAIAPEPMTALTAIITLLSELTGQPDAFVLSPSLVRGFDYYTGAVFELRHPALPISLGGGGRYDRLTEKFGGQPIAACGGSIGFERLMLLLEEGGLDRSTGAPRACVMIFSDELRAPALQIAARLRAAGVETDLYPGAGKLKNQFKYADARGIPFALLIGPDEAAAGTIRVKNMKTGVETVAAPNDVIALVTA